MLKMTERLGRVVQVGAYIIFFFAFFCLALLCRSGDLSAGLSHTRARSFADLEDVRGAIQCAADDDANGLRKLPRLSGPGVRVPKPAVSAHGEHDRAEDDQPNQVTPPPSFFGGGA